MVWALPAFADTPGQFCVENASEHEHVFTTETREGTRQVATLGPGGVLCSGATQARDGVIGVFENAESFEGCGRIIPAGTRETLHAYSEFDRCHWGAHNRE